MWIDQRFKGRKIFKNRQYANITQSKRDIIFQKRLALTLSIMESLCTIISTLSVTLPKRVTSPFDIDRHNSHPTRGWHFWRKSPLRLTLPSSGAGHGTSLHFVSLQSQSDPEKCDEGSKELSVECEEEKFVICKSLRPSWRKWRENIFWKDVPPGVEENDGKKRNKEVEEGGGQHHVQGVACELLLLINVDLKEKRSREKKVIFDI